VNIVRIVATVLLALTLVLGLLNLVVFGLITLGVVAVLDLLLHFKKVDTVSQRIHKWFPQWGDFGVLALFGVLIGTRTDYVVFFWVAIGVLLGHLFWND